LPSDQRFTVVILAAQRDGRAGPLAIEAGVTHKCLVPIGGKPLLAHVLGALDTVERIARVTIVVEDGAADLLRPLTDASGLPVSFVNSADNIADSVYRAAQDAVGPLVVTTADNVLLTADAVRRVADALRDGADAVVALATKETVLAAHPEGQRRFYRFRDDSYSNCNLYGLSGRGIRLAEAFRSGGQFASNPRRIARAVGLINLIVMRFALVSLVGAMRLLGRRFGVTAAAVVLADGAHAVDVDNERTYRVAAELLSARADPKRSM
jgi:GTP:adenosylcobinamide-phosphate guanylyltransferase